MIRRRLLLVALLIAIPAVALSSEVGTIGVAIFSTGCGLAGLAGYSFNQERPDPAFHGRLREQLLAEYEEDSL